MRLGWGRWRDLTIRSLHLEKHAGYSAAHGDSIHGGGLGQGANLAGGETKTRRFVKGGQERSPWIDEHNQVGHRGPEFVR